MNVIHVKRELVLKIKMLSYLIFRSTYFDYINGLLFPVAVLCPSNDFLLIILIFMSKNRYFINYRQPLTFE